ncbi:cysteine peptidase family C39 domain-containing protein [Pedobacter frigidisoli]|uniref:cysteine peptidase family C39 domain-containing protein n=1 Tax=Pedobacter frigidisoli TaxID=2530455 RepID=UPI00292F79FE|nr:cysteine peptidase family C39 domain-containing protein [Pedobacter frigidisoli]
MFRKPLSNLESVAVGLIENQRFGITRTSVRTCLQEHPEYPSLLSISDCLDGWNVSNTAYNVPHSEFSSYATEVPFIVHLREGNGKFLLIEEIRDESIIYSNQHLSKKEMSKQEFLNRWGGTIFLVEEKNEKISEDGYKTKRLIEFARSLLLPFIAISLLILFGLKVAASKYTIELALIFFIKTLGLLTSVALLIQKFNSDSPFIKQLCNIKGKNGCNEILKSSAANLTSWLSWSEVGFFYFLGSIISLLSDARFVNVFAWFNVLAIPYTFYSIGYQLKTKTYCFLCCTVQILLWMEFFAFQYYARASGQLLLQSWNLSFSSVFVLVISLLVPMISWWIIKPLIQAKIDLTPINQKLRKFTNHSEVFKMLLTKERFYEISHEHMPITFGDINSENHLVIISNPYCRPCAKMHAEVVELIKTFPHIKISILFALNERNKDQVEIALSLLSLFRTSPPADALIALDAWYLTGKDDPANWKNRFQSTISELDHQILNEQQKWISNYSIKSTPTLIFNQYQLPDLYDLKTLKSVLNSI